MNVKSTLSLSVLVVNLATVPAFANTAFVSDGSNWRSSTNEQSTTDISNSQALIVTHTTDKAELYKHRFEHLKLVFFDPAGRDEATKNVGGITSSSISSIPKTLFSSSTPLPQQVTVNSPLQGFCHPLNGQGWLSQGIRGKTHRGHMEFV